MAGTVTFPVLAITSMDGTGPRAAPGASVSPAVPLFTITDLTQVVFAAQVDEADIGGVAPGQDARVTLDSYPGTDFTGKVSQVATSSVTTKTGGVAYVVKVPLTAGDGRLRLGMSGDAALATATVPQALVVPASCGVHSVDLSLVYGFADGGPQTSAQPVETLMRNAELALDRARASGGGRYVFFDTTMAKDAENKRSLENDLQLAIRRNEFRLFFQPIIDLPSKRLAGAEALIRWKHPTRGMVPPDAFIPLSEETGLIVDIGLWTLEVACQQLATWPVSYTHLTLPTNREV